MISALSQNELAGFCRRVGTTVHAGLPLLRSIQREADRPGASRRARECWARIAETIENGETLAEAVRREQRLLSPLFVAVVDVAEQSGRLGETLLELADDYDRIIHVRRAFIASLYMPIFELVAALGVVGLVILIMGFLPGMNPQAGESTNFDLLGLGLKGSRGLLVYLTFLAFIAAVGVLFYYLVKAGTIGSRLFQYVLRRVPEVGSLLKTLAEARLARSFYLTHRTGMDVFQAIRLSFNAAGFAPVSDQQHVVLKIVAEGGTLGEGFAATRGLDMTLVHNIGVGDESGETPELMRRTSEILMQEATLKLKRLSVIGFFLVFGLVAAIIIFFIFRLLSFYLGAISGAM
ncbi:MAG TPA: hypothetical protein DEB39_07110 [Planctomycetaceae bacterium]|nr:hypothetical protein [Planctomycetaceae bacterium]